MARLLSGRKQATARRLVQVAGVAALPVADFQERQVVREALVGHMAVGAAALEENTGLGQTPPQEPEGKASSSSLTRRDGLAAWAG